MAKSLNGHEQKTLNHFLCIFLLDSSIVLAQNEYTQKVIETLFESKSQRVMTPTKNDHSACFKP